MCGRYSLVTTESLAKRFDVMAETYDMVADKIEPHYNISPGQFNPIIRSIDGKNEVALMKWGLVPFWAKDSKQAYNMINARAESIATKPAYRKSFKTQRCIVPANGFFEWQKYEGDGQKQPYYIHLKNQEIMGFAGLYDEWEEENGKKNKTYTIITTDANAQMEKIHDRMPVILGPEDEKVWLSDAPSELLSSLLVPYQGDYMEMYPISTAVNRPSNDTVDVIERVHL